MAMHVENSLVRAINTNFLKDMTMKLNKRVKTIVHAAVSVGLLFVGLTNSAAAYDRHHSNSSHNQRHYDRGHSGHHYNRNRHNSRYKKRHQGGTNHHRYSDHRAGHPYGKSHFFTPRYGQHYPTSYTTTIYLKPYRHSFFGPSSSYRFGSHGNSFSVGVSGSHSNANSHARHPGTRH